MTLYRYSALSEMGKKVSGVIDADSLAAAKDRLRRDQILVVEVAALADKEKEIVLPILLDFTRMIGQLLKAGIPLYESLVIIEEKYHREKFHPLLVDLCDALRSGLSLSAALSRYPKTFTPVYIAMVKAGEQTASLGVTFEELCRLLAHQQKLKKQLFAAAAYPLFLGTFCLIVFLSLLLFVIPSMKALFEGRDLHPITKIVFGASDLMVAHGASIFIGLSIFILSVITLVRQPVFRLKFDLLILKLPFLGDFLREAATIRFCKTASLLMQGGIPIIETLELGKQVMKNRPLEEVIGDAAQRVSEGKSLSEELQKSPLIPSIVSRMLAIGEETGKTAFMLQSIANICEENLEKKLHQLTAVLQPVLLLLLGLIVGVVLLSILIPLSDVGSVITI